MNSNELKNILRKKESPKLEFKREFYAIHSEAREMHWAEFIKDVISIANGNLGYAKEKGYLIIGPENEIPSVGIRKIHNIGDISVTASLIQNKINSVCHPPIPEIEMEMVKLDKDEILVISISLAPFLHQLTRTITTTKTTYHRGTVFIRRIEEVAPASLEEIDAIKSEKDNQFRPQREMDRLTKRIKRVSEDIDDKKTEYRELRNKAREYEADDNKILQINKEIEYDNKELDFLLTKLKIEQLIDSNGSIGDISNRIFHYALKLIDEKIPKISADFLDSNALVDEIREDARRKLELAVDNGCSQPRAFYYLIQIWDLKGEPMSAYEWVRNSMIIEHEFPELCQLHIKICKTVKSLYSDYSEEASNHIVMEQAKLRKMLKKEVDDWGQPIDARQ